MRIPTQENNPQSQASETQSVRENTAYTEFTPTREQFTSRENTSYPELPEPSDLYQANSGSKPNKGGDNVKNTKLLSQYVATTMVGVVAGAATLGIITIVDEVKLRINAEDVSFNNYAVVCDLENPKRLSLDFTVTDESGKVAKVLNVNDGWQGKEITFYNLTPETSYCLTVTDQNGKAYFEDSFTTESFVTVTPNAQNALLWDFALHEDFSWLGDMQLNLLTSDGRDFSSNVLFSPDPAEQSVICLEGLYADDYALSCTYFPPPIDGVEENSDSTDTSDSTVNEWEGLEEVTYQKTLTFGSLQTPQFTPLQNGTDIILTYLSGDILPYNQFNIILSNDTGAWHSLDRTIVRQDGNDFHAELPADIESGTYRLEFWGEFENQTSLFYNEIFRGEITITL